MTVDYNLIFKDGLTDAAIDEAIEFARIKIYRDIDEVVRRRKCLLNFNLEMKDYTFTFTSLRGASVKPVPDVITTDSKHSQG